MIALLRVVGFFGIELCLWASIAMLKAPNDPDWLMSSIALILALNSVLFGFGVLVFAVFLFSNLIFDPHFIVRSIAEMGRDRRIKKQEILRQRDEIERRALGRKCL